MKVAGAARSLPRAACLMLHGCGGLSGIRTASETWTPATTVAGERARESFRRLRVARSMRAVVRMRSWLSVLGCLQVVALAACIDAPVERGAPFARLVAAWDPLACGDPHRVVIELGDDDGAGVSSSTPCNIGGLTVDVAHFGIYRGRIYAWVLGAAIRSEAAIEVTIDRPIVQWMVATPR